MVPNGKSLNVEFKDINSYIDTLRGRKISESKLQIKRITQGLAQLIPLPYLHCLTGEELKLIICGRPKVDVDLLKKHTKYSGGLNEESRRIKFFWEIMKELPEVDRLKIIRFCWGQERLPINSEEFERNNIRFMIKPMINNEKNQDQALPKADTCFFNIELPDYSTKAIMREKVMLAVNLDNVSINADEAMMNSEDNPLMNEIDEYGQDEDEEEG